MQRQVEANDIRIEILEKENKVLLKTISKVPNSGNSPPESIPTERSDFSIQPVQLWRTEENRESSYNYRSKLNTRSRATLTPSKSEIGSNNNKKETEVRSSFHVGPGKRRSATPTSGRSALVKPWT
uniref:Uncharacterized protein n=1 Tax=Ciona savignyi TaxID=51511 RepID=H2YBH5_CIOSA